MTTTQVRYWEFVEGKRHNVATERLESSRIKQEGTRIAETKRHNIVSEKLTASDIMEKIRHNKASERLTATQLAEVNRHNLAQESIDRERNAIGRAQLVVDREKLANEIVKTNEGVRHNKAMEEIDRAYKEAQADLAKADTKKKQQEVEYKFWDTLANSFGSVGNLAGGLAKVITAV